MYLRWLFYAGAIVNVLFGLGFLFAPQALAASYGATLDATAITVARYLGGALLPTAYLAWAAATAAGSPLKLQVVRAFALYPLLQIVVTIIGMSAGVVNASGGIFNLVLGAVFLVGFGYYGWMRSEPARG